MISGIHVLGLSDGLRTYRTVKIRVEIVARGSPGVDELGRVKVQGNCSRGKEVQGNVQGEMSVFRHTRLDGWPIASLLIIKY